MPKSVKSSDVANVIRVCFVSAYSANYSDFEELEVKITVNSLGVTLNYKKIGTF